MYTAEYFSQCPNTDHRHFNIARRTMLLVVVLFMGFCTEPGFCYDEPSFQVWLDIGKANNEVTGAVGIRHSWYGIDIGWLRYDTHEYVYGDDGYVVKSLLGPLPIPQGSREVGTVLNGVGPGFDLLGFFDIRPRLSLFAGGGAYFERRYHVYYVPQVDGYLQTKPFTRVEAGYGGGIHWAYRNILVGLSWHNLRGPSGSIGLSFW